MEVGRDALIPTRQRVERPSPFCAKSSASRGIFFDEQPASLLGTLKNAAAGFGNTSLAEHSSKRRSSDEKLPLDCRIERLKYPPRRNRMPLVALSSCSPSHRSAKRHC
jgi:hypothetical protein